ncbi:MAG: acetylxylan esterase [Planctomycetaceae bacterium]|nr:acetylxylan esterase [Planctomycetaceae bacterium]
MPGRLLVFPVLLVCLASSPVAAEVPQTVTELWQDFDPRRDDLDVQLIREWTDDGIVFRYVTYHIGTFKNQPARMAAFYAFPKGAKQLPGLLHVHGGGQRAFLREVDYYARRGYACLSINWGGREMEQAQPDDPNTDWGAVNPTQTNVPGYFNLRPGELYLDAQESPRNNNWYLLTLGSRRGLTFLEQQPEVDASRLGVYGHSMGGNLTIYVAGTDERVKVAAPSVGGSGFRNQPWPLLPQQQPRLPDGDVHLFDATIGFESYAPLIQAPTLWLSATNDFHGIMDDTYRTGALIPHDNVRYAMTPHLNHRFTPEFEVTRPLWIDQYLKGTFMFPKTPQSTLTLQTDNGIPQLLVTPDATQPIDRVQLMYSIDPDPQARFWRTAEATQNGNQWSAALPLLNTDQPLFAVAQVVYQLPEPVILPNGETTTYAITSLLHTATPTDLQAAGCRATDASSTLIDDFVHGWQDWYTLSANNPHHWEFSTRKLSDPKWQGQPGQRLTFEVQSDEPNQLVIIATEHFFRPYRGRQTEYVAVVDLTGGDTVQTFSLAAEDFKAADGTPLTNWSNLDLLSWRAYTDQNGTLLGSKNWQGPQPEFSKLRWEAGE